MQCIVTYAAGLYKYISNISSEIRIFNFGYLSFGHYIYVSKDVRICGYFLKPERVHKKKVWETLLWRVGAQIKVQVSTEYYLKMF